ncbi:hypothetical protein CHGG_04333 [Chaetomium globosum CBS 148.51]|jgi:uncharacterized membrane protein YqaE (UPF0057 family)|uniref:Stress response RCI peptide n=1 Tax=Chaetomium globosum (strain ATCC 6205 / CBS 148.51 / DSM 1962 / NBRC 6347 / NRRL 1970) TaxID=306901 RepID=Q2H1L3_CHAGB|nr:uncharacterized protein CHGG_04333 [Chaetomium globosum CBS 148.51]EAQ87714.1 hypothetical protein CHGG_04333 [Chaetomium globosum CBS 148.51]
MCSQDIFLGLLAVLFPPLAVWVKRGLCSADSIINILLLILGYIPGLLHAWYIIAKYPEPPYDYDYQGVPQDAEHGRIYVFVNGTHGDGRGRGQQAQGYQPQQAAHAQPPKPQGHMNYGTSNSSAPQQQHHHQPQEQGTTAEAGPSDGSAPPPSYAQVVAGDHKIQNHD